MKHSTLSFPKLKGGYMDYYKEPDKAFLTKEEGMLLKLKRTYLELDLHSVAKDLDCSGFDILKIEDGTSPDKELSVKYKFLVEKAIENNSKTVQIVTNRSKKKYWSYKNG